MACNCIARTSFDVGNIENAASSPIESMIKPQLDTIAAQLCNWAQPEYGDSGESWEKSLWKAALIAIATINTVAQISIMDKRYQIAKDYANLAKDRWARFRDGYAPLERAMLSEAGNTEEYDPDYPGAKNRAQTNTNAAFRSANEQIADIAKAYGLCIDPSLLNDMNLSEALSRDDGTNFNYRDEEFWSFYMSDKRWNRRSQLLNLGRNLQQMSFTYADAANNALAGIGSLLDSSAQGAAKLLGYLSTVRETQYPANFSSAAPLTGQASSFGSMIAMGPMAAS